MRLTAPHARFWPGLLAVWMFAAVFLQLGLVDRLAVPASQRVNNGARATFFALHATPYETVSEDFHLYTVRSKRIQDRGWAASLLYDDGSGERNHAAPLQALLMMAAAGTEGWPVPYSLFIFIVIGLSWTVLYVAAAWWLPPAISMFSRLVGILMAVLFESVHHLPFLENAVRWPPDRGLRMSTLAWSRPITLALLIAATSLVVRPHRPQARLVFIAIVLCGLAASDTWSFLIAAGSAGPLTAVMALVLMVRVRRRAPVRDGVVAGVGLVGAVALAAVVHLSTNSLSGDAVSRAGFGPRWLGSPAGMTGSQDLTAEMLFIAVLAFAACLRLSRPAFRFPTPGRAQIALLLAAPIVAVMLLTIALTWYGMFRYHLFQFFWRRDFVMLFGLALVAAEFWRRWPSGPMGWRRPLGLRVFAVSLLVALFAYHNVRMFRHVSQIAAREYFLTEEHERLLDWLRGHRPPAERYVLATASHELNHLFAYWTNADLLLPEGFPYHNAGSNQAIEERMARVLAVYGATPDRWRAFNLHRVSEGQVAWRHSRLLSARFGYTSYLQHHELILDGEPSVAGESRPELDQEWQAQRVAGIHAADRIARLLEARPALSDAERPDVIVIDEVSRALGEPDLTGYRQAFRHGAVEAWVAIPRRRR